MLLSEADCWNLVREQKCDGKQIKMDGHAVQYVEPPTGEGKWYSTVEHTVVNCVLQEIDFSYKGSENPILVTPFGALNISVAVNTAIMNHNRLVWTTPQELKFGNCSLNDVLRSSGDVTQTETQGRLVDHNNQLEILFTTTKVRMCDDTSLHAVNGVPKLFVFIPHLFVNRTLKSKRIPRETSRNNRFTRNYYKPRLPQTIHRRRRRDIRSYKKCSEYFYNNRAA